MQFQNALRSVVSASLVFGAMGSAFPWSAWSKAGILTSSAVGYYYGAVYKTLHSFNPANVQAGEGLHPVAGLTPGASGVLLGTTSAPGRAYALFPPGAGSSAWTEAVIANVANGSSAPLTPISATELVGVEPGSSTGFGDIFKLTVSGTSVTKSVVFYFSGGAGGTTPISALTYAPASNTLFGTATGGSGGGGIVYSLAVGKKGQYSEKVLYSFTTGGIGGSGPVGDLVFNSTGTALLGGTAAGGAHNQGTIYSVTPKGAENVLYSFAGGADGASPGGLTTADGLTFYGATSGGGNGQGTVFSITSKGKYAKLYTFANTADGHTPNPELVLDASGALYGTAQGGGYGKGTAWVLIPPATKKSSWSLQVVYSFGSNVGDGAAPTGRLVIDSEGSLYGASLNGGYYGYGADYEIIP